MQTDLPHSTAHMKTMLPLHSGMWCNEGEKVWAAGRGDLSPASFDSQSAYSSQPAISAKKQQRIIMRSCSGVDLIFSLRMHSLIEHQTVNNGLSEGSAVASSSCSSTPFTQSVIYSLMLYVGCSTNHRAEHSRAGNLDVRSSMNLISIRENSQLCWKRHKNTTNEWACAHFMEQSVPMCNKLDPSGFCFSCTWVLHCACCLL